MSANGFGLGIPFILNRELVPFKDDLVQYLKMEKLVLNEDTGYYEFKDKIGKIDKEPLNGKLYQASISDASYVIADHTYGDFLNHTFKFRCKVGSLIDSIAEPLIGATDSLGRRYDIYLRGDGDFRLVYPNVTQSTIATTSEKFLSGKVLDVELKFNNAGVLPTLKVNGVTLNFESPAGLAVTYPTNKMYLFTIGAGLNQIATDGVNEYPTDNAIGDVRIYDPSDKLIHSWHCDEGDGTVAYDSVECRLDSFKITEATSATDKLNTFRNLTIEVQ